MTLKRISVVLLATLACASPDTAIDRTEGSLGLRGLEFEQPFAAPSFELATTEGTFYDFRAETEGTLTFVFFGYTHCPDICPVQMAILDAALSDLDYRDRRQIKVVFVTTDPARDTPERLRAWLDRFDNSYVGLTGEPDAVNAVLAEFQLPASQIEPPRHPDGSVAEGEAGPEDNYFVGHATPVIAITGDGQVRAFYPSGIRQTDWRHDLPRLIALHESVSPAQAASGP